MRVDSTDSNHGVSGYSSEPFSAYNVIQSRTDVRRTSRTEQAREEQALWEMEQAFSCLAPLASRLSCVFVQPRYVPTSLTELSWESLHIGTDFQDEARVPKSDAVLVISYGVETAEARAVLRKLSKNHNCPVLIAVLVVPQQLEACRAPTPEVAADPGYESLMFGNMLVHQRKELFEAGADDIVCLLGDEKLKPHRVLEAAERSEYVAEKMSELIQEEVSAVKARSDHRLKEAYRRFLTHVAGTAMDGLPEEDPNLSEDVGDSDQLNGVGKYRFTGKLGSGSFGSVYKTEHPKHGTLAVKVISKAVIRNVKMLFSLDRELNIMRHLVAHPNVVKAHNVFHSKKYYHIVMSYGGPLDLHQFTKQTLQQTNGTTLPRETILSFAAQQTFALSHLHTHSICHLDLKPDNFVVRESGDHLSLTDFGLSKQLVSVDQPLTNCCGSLPFCAPEVFAIGLSEQYHPGYDGFKADMWSLGVNFIELATGPYSVERLLGWTPSRPTDESKVLANLETLSDLWESVPALQANGLHQVVLSMVVVPPGRRPTVQQVLGPQGLGVQQQVRPPRHGSRSGRPGRQAFLSQGSQPISPTSALSTPQSQVSPFASARVTTLPDLDQ